MTPFAMLLALIAFSPTQAAAKDPGGGHGDHGGGGGGGDHDGRVGHGGVSDNAGINLGVRSNAGDFRSQTIAPHQVYDARHRPDFSGGREEGRDGWRYRWDNDRWWFWGPDSRWMWYGDDGQWQYYGNVYVVQRPIVKEFSGGPIKIINPAKNKASLSYTLNGNTYTIQPGYSQEIPEDRAWVIEFSRGADLEDAQYTLQSGVYTFTSTDQGWELYRGEFRKMEAPKAAPQPPKAAPTNPATK